jgi:uncharacterized protein
MRLPSRLASLLAAFAAASALAIPAHAQAVPGLDGRWEGPLELPNGIKLTAVFRVVTKDGQTTTVFDSPEQGAKDVAASVKREGETVTFNVPMGGVTYTAKLSADGKTLTGDISQGGGSIPMTMVQKPAGAVTAITTPAVQGLDGRWEGALSTPGGDLVVAFRISTAGGKTTTLLDSVTQNNNNIPALARREGQKVTIDSPGIGGSYSATLSADGKTLDGVWSQMGNDLLLQMAKK